MGLLNIFLFATLFNTVIAVIIYLNHQHAKKNKQARQLQGINWLKKLKRLLTAMQQHRGLSMGYLNGDKALVKRIQPLEESINQQIREINLEKDWLQDNLVWFGINDHWLRLSVHYEEYESEHNFRQHCHLIANLLSLIEDCAEYHHLHELVYTQKDNANLLWSQLLITAEHIGQARAIGTSIAAAQKSSAVQRIRLNYLQTSINEFIATPNQQLDNTLIVELLTTIDTKILSDTASISAEAFFNLATAALDSLSDNFDRYLNALQEKFQSETK